MRPIPWDPDNPRYCDTFWGSHGCSLPPGHKEPCVCDDRSRDEDGTPIGDIIEDNGYPAIPPYYGPETEFFSNHGTPTPPQTLAAARGE